MSVRAAMKSRRALQRCSTYEGTLEATAAPRASRESSDCSVEGPDAASGVSLRTRCDHNSAPKSLDLGPPMLRDLALIIQISAASFVFSSGRRFKTAICEEPAFYASSQRNRPNVLTSTDPVSGVAHWVEEYQLRLRTRSR